MRRHLKIQPNFRGITSNSAYLPKYGNEMVRESDTEQLLKYKAQLPTS